MSEYFVYAETGEHRGPFSIEGLVAALADGSLPRTARVGSIAEGWRAVAEIPELTAALAGPSCYRVLDGAFTRTARGTPEFGATVMMVGTPRRDSAPPGKSPNGS